jgi:hypothetical protein
MQVSNALAQLIQQSHGKKRRQPASGRRPQRPSMLVQVYGRTRHDWPRWVKRKPPLHRRQVAGRL